MVLVWFYVMAFGMGVIMAIYLPVLGQSGKLIGSPILANVPFFAAGMVTSFILALVMGNRLADFARLKDVPWWMFLAGVVSGLMILGSTYLLPKISPGPFFVLLVAGQIAAGALISHYGMLGAPVAAISAQKLMGITLAISGAALVTFG